MKYLNDIAWLQLKRPQSTQAQLDAFTEKVSIVMSDNYLLNEEESRYVALNALIKSGIIAL